MKVRVVSGRNSLLVALVIIGTVAFGCGQPAATPPAPTAAAPSVPASVTTAAATAVQPAAPTKAPAATTAAATSPAPAVSAGELRISVGAMGSEVFDPKDISMYNYYAPLIYDFLVGVTPDGKLSKETGLATDWQVSPDLLTWTFTVRKGVKFQNGDDLTAEDVRASLDRIIGPKATSGSATDIRAAVQSWSAPDANTVVAKLKGVPKPGLAYLLSQMNGQAGGAILPKKYIEQVGDNGFNAKPVGSGPYRLASVQAGTEIKLEAVSNHWRVGVPKYKNVIFKIIGEPTTLVASLKRGEIDIAMLPVGNLKDLAGYNIAQKKDANMIGLMLTQQWEDVPYKDVRVREALALAIDKKAINDTLMGGLGTPNPSGPIGGNLAIGYPRDLAEVPLNLDRAKQLMKDAGYAQGFDLTLYSVPRAGGYDLDKMAEMVTEQWRALNVRATIKRMDYPTIRPLWMSQKLPNAAWVYTAPNLPLIDAIFRPVFASDGVSRTIMDPTFDALLKEWNQAKTLDEYAVSCAKVFRFLHDNYNQIGLVTGGEYYGTSAALKGWNPGSVPGYFDVDSLIKQK